MSDDPKVVIALCFTVIIVTTQSTNFRKMNWLRSFLFKHSSTVEQESEVVGDRRNSLTDQQSDIDKQLEHAEMQPKKRQRKVDDSMVIYYDQEQGSSSNCQLTCHFDWVSSDSSVHPRIVTLKEKLCRLFARQCDVLTELEQAEIQPGKKRRKEVHHWLTLVQRKKDEIQSVIKDSQGSSFNSNLSSCIERFIEEVEELFQRGKFPNGLVLSNEKGTRLPLLLGIKPVGKKFHQNAEKILGWLEDDEHCIIGVYGMGGVGKTTLLMHIHDQLLQDEQVYWVTASQNCTVYKLQQEIAKVLGIGNFEEDDEIKRAAILHNIFAAKGKIILILDDMWKQILLGSQVGIPLEGSSCKVIVSTRLLDVCQKMGCKNFVIKAEILDDGEAWDLFAEKLGHYDTLDKEAKLIAWNVASECGGLPLAIATMARCMSGVVDIIEWKNALNELKSARDQVDMKEDVIRILQFSYDRLNDKRVQNCFLSCVLYGEDMRIGRNMLIDLWIDEGLLDEIESREDQVVKAQAILNKLESWCLLESVVDDDEKYVKMHDLIRDMGIVITKKYPRFIAKTRERVDRMPKDDSWSKDLVKVSLSDNIIKEIPSDLAPMTPNLTVLMLNGNPLQGIPDSFFVHMRALRVLDLSCTNIKRVPNSVSDLRALRVLDLSFTDIERVPDCVSDLENLRSLSLAKCKKLMHVPSITKLAKLRVLDLKRCYKLEETPRGIERLKGVEKVSYCPWDISDMSGFNKFMKCSTLSYRFWIRDPTLFKSIDKLEKEKYGLCEYDFWNYEKAVWIIGGICGEDESKWLLPNTLEMLGIDECHMKGRSLRGVFPSMEEATCLKTLILRNCTGLEYIIGSSKKHQGSSLLCSQLEVLDLAELPDLRSITILGAAYSFSRLRDLIIMWCPNIKVVFPFTEQTPHLPYLRTIAVLECEEVEEIFESNNMATQPNPILFLPNLKWLSLENLPKLSSIYRGLLFCSSLFGPNPIIKGCPKLKLLPRPKGVIVDESWSTMESMSGNTNLLETLHQDFSQQDDLTSDDDSEFSFHFSSDDDLDDSDED